LPKIAAGSVLSTESAALVMGESGGREEGAAADLAFSVEEVADEELLGVRGDYVRGGEGGARGRDGPREEPGEQLVGIDSEEVGLVVRKKRDDVQAAVGQS